MKVFSCLVIIASFQIRCDPGDFDWRDIMEPRYQQLDDKFPPPEGYDVVTTTKGSFGHYLSGLRVRRDRSPRPNTLADFSGYYDGQQHGEWMIRIHAQWLWNTWREHEAAYHVTGTIRSAWTEWREGEVFELLEGKVERIFDPIFIANPSTEPTRRRDLYRQFKTYLNSIFRFAGTLTLLFDSTLVAVEDVRAGDFFLLAGSPGRAVMVMSVVKNDAGETLLLLGHGDKDSRDFQVIESSTAVDSFWFEPPSAVIEMETPTLGTFPASSLRRFKILPTDEE